MCCVKKLRVSSYLLIFSDAVMGWTDGKMKKKTTNKKSLLLTVNKISLLPAFIFRSDTVDRTLRGTQCAG